MKKVLVAGGLFIVLGLAVFWTKDTQVGAPARIGHFWTGKTGETSWLCYVTAEERARRRAVIGGRNPTYTTDSYYRYRLQVRRLPGGEITSEVLLGDFKRNLGKPAPEIVGVVGEVLWLWHNQLQARALPTLALHTDETAFRQAQPGQADLLPREAKQYKVLASPAGLVTRATDAKFYLVDPKGFALTLVAATDLPRTSSSSRPENWFDFILTPAEGRSFTLPYNQMKRNLLTRQGTWYALMSESERAEMPKWVAEESQPSGEVARSLYRASYQRDDRYAIIDPKAIERVGDASFIQAGFILRHDRAPWQVAAPDSALVLGKRRLGAAEPWEVTRLGNDGTVIWQTSTGLADPSEFLDVDGYLVVAGRILLNGGLGTEADRRERVLWIDEATGAKTSLLVATGEITK